MSTVMETYVKPHSNRFPQHTYNNQAMFSDQMDVNIALHSESLKLMNLFLAHSVRYVKNAIITQLNE